MPSDQTPDVASLAQTFIRSRVQGRRVSVDQMLTESGISLDVQSREMLISDISRCLRESANGSHGAAPSERAPMLLPDIPGYDLIEEVGRGGMGIVYEAYQHSTGRRVAVKVMSQHVAANDAARRRFEREVELVARLQHPGIASVLDSGTHAEHPFCVQEFVEGVTLDVFLSSEGAATGLASSERVRAILAILVEICDAVEYAYQRGVLHRDLKPSNILVDARGHPRIVDFGLAKDVDPFSSQLREQTIAMPGEILGTLAYMAPEQARGARDQISIRSDLYSLGAIAYEALTGRLPCPADGTLKELLERIEHQDPAPPSSINRELSADIDAVLLRTLDKQPLRRYASAAELRDELKRLLAFEPVQARPVGRAARTLRWARRRPAQAALVFTVLLLVSGAAGTGIWLNARRASTVRDVESDLREVVQFQQRALWAEAGAALERAKGRLGDQSAGDLGRRVKDAARSLTLVARIDAMRMARADFVKTGSADLNLDHDYEQAFDEAGLSTSGVDPVRFADDIRVSDVRATLLSALMDWASVTSDQERSAWLKDVTNRVDPGAWETRMNDPGAWDDPTTLAEWIRSAPLQDQPVQTLVALAEKLQARGGDAAAFLRRVQRAHPDDFWANFELAIALRPKPREAVGYYRAALALRPNAAVVHNNLGLSLAENGQTDEAVGHFEEAVRIGDHPGGHINLGYIIAQQGDPAKAIDHFEHALQQGVRTPFLHNGYGIALKMQGRLDEAIAQYETALRLDPDLPVVQRNMAQALIEGGHPDQAIEHYREVVRLEPSDAAIQGKLWTLLASRGHLEEARVGWRETVAADPAQHAAWFGYAELCLFLGDEAEYRHVRHGLLARFGSTTDPVIAERTGRSCLLLPASGDELLQAVALCDRPIADKTFREAATYRPYFLFVKGLAAYRQDRLDEAVTLMQGEASTVLGPAPRLVLAMAQQRTGLHAQATETLAAAVSSFDWNESQATDQERWTFHVLRREAENLILGR